ncbi:hypothetical protein WDZ11_00175 (plasmid) [Roseomonas mucosa]|uniref:hypothetical protein n=1 Tax=Roseomonas mucosa TaxID=207340 RepID=UPI0030D38A06
MRPRSTWRDLLAAVSSVACLVVVVSIPDYAQALGRALVQGDGPSALWNAAALAISGLGAVELVLALYRASRQGDR